MQGTPQRAPLMVFTRFLRRRNRGSLAIFFAEEIAHLDERQITHLICARLKYDLYDFFGGVLCFGAFYTGKRTESRPKTENTP